jgi:hypothetical protein
LAREVTDPDEKWRSFEALVEHVAAGRWEGARRPTEAEARSTRVLAISITEASAKIRKGPPKDDAEDLGLPVWAGVIPFKTVALAPVDAPDLTPGLTRPGYASDYRRPGW